MLGVLGVMLCLGILLELDEVEVIAAVLDRGGAGERGRRAGEDGQAGRHGEGFLGAGQQDVNAQRVEIRSARR